MIRTGWLLALAAAACAGPVPHGAAGAGEAPAASAVHADSLRGTLLITGSEPGVVHVLVDGAVVPSIIEGDRVLLQRVAGLDLTLRGTRDGITFHVESVAVRAANGVPAVDGVLAREDGRDLLVLADGRRMEVARLPGALRGRTGARVWLAGPLDGDIDSFGILADAP